MLFSALILCVSLCVYVCAFLLLPHKFQHCYILGTYLPSSHTFYPVLWEPFDFFLTLPTGCISEMGHNK